MTRQYSNKTPTSELMEHSFTLCVSFMGKHCSNQWNAMSFWRHLCSKCCSLTVCGAKGQCIVAHSVAPVNLCAAAHDWVSQFPFVKSFCLVFIIHSTSLKHEMWFGAQPSQLCNPVSSKCAVCGSCSITSSLKSEWCLLHMALCPGKAGWGLWLRINAMLGDGYSTGLMFLLNYMF